MENVGSQLGTFRLLERVGGGGFAIVYLGRDLRTNEIVAVKILRAQYAEDPQFIMRFRREAETLRALPPHPNIVGLREFGQQDSTCFIVLEYLEGKDLSQILTEHGRLPVEAALSIALQVALALDVAHQYGLVHRDIKPANIKVTPDGTAKVMDFGIARAAEGTKVTQTGMFVGTPDYMAPEIWEGNPADIRSDIYALGALLYEMLTGTAPFHTDTPAATMRRHLLEHPQAVRTVQPSVPANIEAMLTKMMAKQPEERYQVPAQVVGELRRYIKKVPIPIDMGAANRGQASARGEGGARHVASDARASITPAQTRSTAALTPVLPQKYRLFGLDIGLPQIALGVGLLALSLLWGIAALGGASRGTATPVPPTAAPYAVAIATFTPSLGPGAVDVSSLSGMRTADAVNAQMTQAAASITSAQQTQVAANRQQTEQASSWQTTLDARNWQQTQDTWSWQQTQEAFSRQQTAGANSRQQTLQTQSKQQTLEAQSRQLTQSAWEWQQAQIAASATQTALARRITVAPSLGYYTLSAKRYPSLCLGVQSNSQSDGAFIEQRSCSGSASQSWGFQDMGGGYYQLVAKSSGKCMTVQNGSRDDWELIVQQTCRGADHQLWSQKSFGGYVQLIAKHSGKCIDEDAFRRDEGLEMQQGPCNPSDNDNQLWSKR